MIKKTTKILGIGLLLIFITIIGAAAFLQTDKAKKIVFEVIVSQLNKNNSIIISYDNFKVSLFNEFVFENVLVKNLKQDTLFFSHSINVKNNQWFSSFSLPHITGIECNNFIIHLPQNTPNLKNTKDTIDVADLNLFNNKSVTNIFSYIKHLKTINLFFGKINSSSTFFSFNKLLLSLNNFSTNYSKKKISLDNFVCEKPYIEIKNSNQKKNDKQNTTWKTLLNNYNHTQKHIYKLLFLEYQNASLSVKNINIIDGKIIFIDSILKSKNLYDNVSFFSPEIKFIDNKFFATVNTKFFNNNTPVSVENLEVMYTPTLLSIKNKDGLYEQTFVKFNCNVIYAINKNFLINLNTLATNIDFDIKNFGLQQLQSKFNLHTPAFNETIDIKGKLSNKGFLLNMENIAIHSNNVNMCNIQGKISLKDSFINSELIECVTQLNIPKPFLKSSFYHLDSNWANIINQIETLRGEVKINGTIQKNYSQATLTSNIGNANMKIMTEYDNNHTFNLFYKIDNGNVTIKDVFNLHQLKTNDIQSEGKIAIHSNDKTIEYTTNVSVKELSFDNHSITNIVSNGNGNNNFFKSKISTHSDSLNIETEIILKHLENNKNIFNISGNIWKIKTPNGYNINTISNKNPAKISANIIFSTQADIEDVFIQTEHLNINETEVKQSTLTLTTYPLTTLKINIDDNTLFLTGEYQWNNIINNLRQYYYYTIKQLQQSQKKPIEDSILNNQIELKLSIIDMNMIKKIFFPHINYTTENLFVSMVINEKQKIFEAKIQSPFIRYENTSLKNNDIFFFQNDTNIFLSSHIDKITIGKKEINNIKINIDTIDNKKTLSIQTDSGWVKLNVEIPFELNSTAIYANIKKFNFDFNTYQWHLTNKEASFIYNFNEEPLQILNFNLEAENQKIFCSTNKGRVEFSIQNMPLHDYFEKFNIDAPVYGFLNLNSLLYYDDNKQYILNNSFNINNFKLNRDSIGQCNGILSYNSNLKSYAIHAKTLNEDYDFEVNKTMHEIDTNVLVNIKINKLKSHILHYYLDDVFKTENGYLRGNLKLKSHQSDYFLEGETFLDNVQLWVNYTNTIYEIENHSKVIFKDSTINFNNLTLYDEEKNLANVNGKVILNLREKLYWAYKFNIQSVDKYQLYNVDYTENPIVFGKAEGKVNLLTSGDLYKHLLHIQTYPTSTKDFSINIGPSKATKDDQWITFNNKNKQMQINTIDENTNVKKNISTEFDFKLYILNKNAPVDVDLYFNKFSNNFIKLKSNIDLNINWNTKNRFSANGIADIVSGEYFLQLKQLGVTKKFIVSPTYSNTIKWTGDINNFNLDIKTFFVASKVDFLSLGLTKTEATPTTTSTTTTTAASNTQATDLADVTINAILRNQSSAKEMIFEIEMPSNIIQNPNYNTWNTYIKSLRTNSNELMKQVAYLIAFETFAPAANNTTNSNLTPQLINTLSNTFLVKNLNDIINKDVIKSNIFSLGFNYNAYNTNVFNNIISTNANTTQIRNQFGVYINAKINKKMSLYFSPNIDFAFNNNINTAASRDNVQVLLPDVKLEWALFNEVPIRLNIFSNNNFDNFTQGSKNKTGLSLSLNKDFDNK